MGNQTLYSGNVRGGNVRTYFLLFCRLEFQCPCCCCCCCCYCFVFFFVLFLSFNAAVWMNFNSNNVLLGHFICTNDTCFNFMRHFLHVCVPFSLLPKSQMLYEEVLECFVCFFSIQCSIQFGLYRNSHSKNEAIVITSHSWNWCYFFMFVLSMCVF